MKKIPIITSLLTMMLCVSLIVGATYALFTGKSQTNIAINSGKVEVVATIKDLVLYSPTSIGMDGTVVVDTNAATEGRFANGGTAGLEGNTLKLVNMTPGDKVNFDIVITNNSNVAVQYRTLASIVSDTGLFAGLKVTIGGVAFVADQESKWTPLAVDSAPIVVSVEVELPTTADDKYQDTSADISFTVSAVQGNTDVGGVNEVIDDATLADAIASKKDYTIVDGTFSQTVVADATTVTIENGTFTQQVVSAKNGGTVIINNAKAGSVESGGGPNILANVNSGATVVINGGSYMTTTIFYGDGTGTAEITGGYFDCGALYGIFYGKPVANLTITGGTFSAMMCMAQGMMGPYIADFVPDTHTIVNNADGSCTVVPK